MCVCESTSRGGAEKIVFVLFHLLLSVLMTLRNFLFSLSTIAEETFFSHLILEWVLL